MGQLSERLAVILAKYGIDPAARQPDLHALAALEAHDAKAALARFHELKRAAAEQRRLHLLHDLREAGFVDGVPVHDTTGMNAKEVEREIRDFTRALKHVRDIKESLVGAREAAEVLSTRAATWRPEAFERVAFDDLVDASNRAEAARRALAREARVERRAMDVQRRARRLKHRRVEAPDVSSAAVPAAAEADRLLAEAEAALDAAERVEEAHERALRPLRDPAVSKWRNTTRKALVARIEAALHFADAAAAARALDAIVPEAEAAREEAAAAAREHTRARRKGRAGPQAERRPGDAFDGYA